jgi:hypothetical protein
MTKWSDGFQQSQINVGREKLLKKIKWGKIQNKTQNKLNFLIPVNQNDSSWVSWSWH